MIMRARILTGDMRETLKLLPDDSIDAIVTDPPGGIVLDPFNGSGSTGCAAVSLGFKYVGCELNEEYVSISYARMKAWAKE